MQLVEVFSAVLGARCVVVAGTAGAVVVDAGVGVADQVVAVLDQRGWQPRAVLATHGHLDHIWDAGPLADRLDVPVVLHPDDRYRLADPVGSIGLDPAALAAVGVTTARYVPPSQVRGLDEPAVAALLDLGGLQVRPRHAPGHTQGSTLYLLQSADGLPAVLSGDVLFAGAIGRTDLPGGDPAAMARTLRTVVAALDPAARVLPGHGPATDVAHELAHNPYLAARPGR